MTLLKSLTPTDETFNDTLRSARIEQKEVMITIKGGRIVQGFIMSFTQRQIDLSSSTDALAQM